MNLQDKDSKQLEEKGISKEELQSQINRFTEGVPAVEVLKHAGINDGIIRFNSSDINKFIEIYEKKDDLEVIKFIPASGAATRMFRALHQFLSEVDVDDNDINEKLQLKDFKILQPLFERIDDLAFYNQALAITKRKTKNFNELSKKEQTLVILKHAIALDGLNLGNLPKGIIPFHEYKNKTLTPFEEHLEESKAYAEKGGKVKLHFTISDGLDEEFDKVLNQYLDKQNENKVNYNVEYSYQKPSTDTIAVNQDNTPYRDENGSLFFRPGGHGALIYNLNHLNADVIFIKNIDNVSKKDEDKAGTATYKKSLGGLLLMLKNQLDEYLIAMENRSLDDQKLSEIKNFAKDKLNIANPAERTDDLFKQLDRPLRICGMVINDGAPGGGPFWIKDKDGRVSLQIIETSQMDLNDDNQKAILDYATHFNPVDIVCSTKDHQGQKFDLLKYVNKDRAFIAKKSVNGHPIKALERPGLWNGAMEYWHTVFVEVPSSTFNPVKTVVDLLKPAHQNR
jgi:hypothetical protein